MGSANPVAPPVHFHVEGEQLIGEAVFGNVYEGPPATSTGVTAAVFDDLLGSVQSAGEQAGMTGRLTVTYRSPTPLHTKVRFIGRLDRVEGRKIFTSGWSEIDGPAGPVRCAGRRACSSAWTSSACARPGVAGEQAGRDPRRRRSGSPSAGPTGRCSRT